MSIEKSNFTSYLALILVVGVMVYVFSVLKPNTFIKLTSPKTSQAVDNLNTSSSITSTNNDDGTMGPATWQDNFSNSLQESVKGKLTFYVTDPPGEPPGLLKKATTTPKPTITTPPLTNTPKPSPVVPTVVLTKVPSRNAALTALVLNIDKVEVHRSAKGSKNSGRWETLNIGLTPKIVDLIALAKTKSDQFLGITSLENGHYTEIRLYISSATATYDDGGHVNLEVLGKNKTVRVVRQFTIETGKTVKMTVDFNAPKSVVRAGEKFILKPVVAKLILE